MRKEIKRVEIMLRSLENDTISSDRLNEVREVFEKYILETDSDYTKAAWESVRLCVAF
jgi:hypothetical protein